MSYSSKNSTALSILALSAAVLASSQTLAADKVTYGTNWLAEAEHGGFYQAVADGTYAKYGLDVSIVQGGPNAAVGYGQSNGHGCSRQG